MSQITTLDDVVRDISSELGYEVYNDTYFSDILGEIYWLFRNVMKPVIPAWHEKWVIISAAGAAQTHDVIYYIAETQRKDFDVIEIRPSAVQNFANVFRDFMKVYMEQRQYVTKSQ